MLVFIFTLSLAGFGIGVIIAVVISWISHRNALPVWTNQTDRAGNYAGKR